MGGLGLLEPLTFAGLVVIGAGVQHALAGDAYQRAFSRRIAFSACRHKGAEVAWDGFGRASATKQCPGCESKNLHLHEILGKPF